MPGRRKARSGLESLDSIFEKRSQLLINNTAEAIVEVYSSGNVNLMKKYETALLALNDSAREGKLAKIAGEENSATISKVGRRPKLTKDAYKEALEKGYTKEQLMNEYSFNPKVLGPMSRHYGPLKK